MRYLQANKILTNIETNYEYSMDDSIKQLSLKKITNNVINYKIIEIIHAEESSQLSHTP